MGKFTGLAGAGGKELAQAAVLHREMPVPQKGTVADIEEEVERFRKVQQEYAEELDALYAKTLTESGQDAAKIFKAYRTIVCDNMFFKKPVEAVRKEQIPMDYAVEREKEKVCAKFEVMPDPYLRERGSDIRNVCDEMIRRLNGIGNAQAQLRELREPFILAAEDLTPEDTVRLDKTFLRGFITEKGGVTSHVVILAKTLGIPAVVGAKGVARGVSSREMLYLDGDEGYAVTGPDETFIRTFRQKKAELDEKKKLYAQAAGEPAVTADGRRVRVCINAGDRDSLGNFHPEECDGIGLYRTEFLFMDQRDYPSEELQFQAYRASAESARGGEVIIRTLDIGGDKQLDYMKIPKEGNPFLGYRAIRVCLDREEVFLTQLRAILRASTYGDVKIMFPMIVTLEELRGAKKVLEKAKSQLREQGTEFREDIPAGIMIETPASVLISDQFAKEAAFFSIGTNDLIQYTTATDRMNEKVQYLYDPCNLSVLRAIRLVIKNAHRAGIPAGMCGEVASDARLTPLLLALGLDEFSVVPAQVGNLKYRIRLCDAGRLAGWAEYVLSGGSIAEVKERLAEQAVK